MPESHLLPLPSDSQETGDGGCCHLCGGPLNRSDTHLRQDGKRLSFCCNGCLYVFRILSERPEGAPADFRETELYKRAVRTGVIPGAHPAREREPLGLGDYPDNLVQESCFRVDGMWCTACGFLVREVLQRKQGMVDVEVFFLSDLVRIRYRPHRTSLQEAMEEVGHLGYRPSLLEDRSGSAPEKRRLLLRLGISAFLTMNIMAISLSLYAGFFRDLGETATALLSYPLGILSGAVLFYGGFPILRRAFAGIRHGVGSMDTLISVGALSAYFYSLVRMVEGSLHLYFDTAAMLITVVLLGRWIEMHARERATRGIDELYYLARQKVRLIVRGKERWVTPEAVRPGEIFEVSGGETVPVDGRLLLGRTTVDESFLTGENRPVARVEGDVIAAGGVILGRSVRMRALSGGEESTLKRVVALIEESLSTKSTVEILADRITRLAVPAVLTLSAVTVLVLLHSGKSWGEALLRATTVLVITCPCALGIATPLARMATLGAARARGILIGRPDAADRMRGLDVMILDKTGTVTEGQFSLRRIVPGEGASAEELLLRTACVESHSDHFIAREILQSARKRDLPIEGTSGFLHSEGLGVKANFRGVKVVAGNREWMRKEGAALPRSLDREAEGLEAAGLTVVYAGWGGKVRGFLALGDVLREESGETVARLQEEGMEVFLVSGDSAQTTAAVARSLGIDHHVGHALPAEKREIVRSLQERGKKVCMVGDGINDAAAMAQADVSIAFGRKSGILRQASDMTILATDLRKVLEGLRLSSFSARVVRENLFLSFSYNLLGIPLAVAGALNPILAVTAMFASSMAVIGNTLRITRKEVSSKESKQ